MPDTTLFMKFVVKPLAKILQDRIKLSKKVSEAADALAKNDPEKSKFIRETVTTWGPSILSGSVLIGAIFYKQNEVTNAMNSLREEFNGQIERLRSQINEMRAENKQWEMERKAKMKEDLERFIAYDVLGVVKKVLREEGEKGKEGLE